MATRKTGIKTLRKLMIDQDLFTITDLARKCGCSRQFIGFLLGGQRRSDRYEACVAEVLGIPRDRLDRLLRP